MTDTHFSYPDPSSHSPAGSTQTEPLPSAPQATGPHKSRAGIGTVAVVGALAACLGAGVGAGAVVATSHNNTDATTSAAATQTTSSTTSLPTGNVAKVADKVLPSVVSIQFSNGNSGGSGSGVVLNKDGLILTNNHVVEEVVNGGTLTVNFSDGKSTDAQIVGRDPSADLAVIRVSGVDNLVPITMGSSSDLQVGQSVVAIGEPLGLTGTVTTGIVSALNRPVLASGNSNGSVLNAIQTDAAINPGNSGGALVNMQGQLVGINSAIATLGETTGQQSGSIGLGFAIPIDQAKWIVNQLVQSGTATHSQLGVSVGDATGDQLGAQVETVENGSAADKAGLHSDDIVTSFNGQHIDSADALVAAVRSVEPGSTVKVDYVRDGNTATTEVTLGTATESQS